MSEIANCPICGGVPLDKWEVTSVRVFQTGQACCGVDCSTNERWNQYAAAMKAEARHAALVEAVAWERECHVLRNELRPFRNWPELAEAVDSYQAARAEVDRLIGEGRSDVKI